MTREILETNVPNKGSFVSTDGQTDRWTEAITISPSLF